MLRWWREDLSRQMGAQHMSPCHFLSHIQIDCPRVRNTHSLPLFILVLMKYNSEHQAPLSDRQTVCCHLFLLSINRTLLVQHLLNSQATLIIPQLSLFKSRRCELPLICAVYYYCSLYLILVCAFILTTRR